MDDKVWPVMMNHSAPSSSPQHRSFVFFLSRVGDYLWKTTKQQEQERTNGLRHKTRRHHDERREDNIIEHSNKINGRRILT